MKTKRLLIGIALGLVALCVLLLRARHNLAPLQATRQAYGRIVAGMTRAEVRTRLTIMAVFLVATDIDKMLDRWYPPVSAANLR